MEYTKRFLLVVLALVWVVQSKLKLDKKELVQFSS